MTRKRFIKLLMSRGYSRNTANNVAQLALCCGYTYDAAYFAVRLKDGEFDETLQAIRNMVADILRIPRSILYATME